MSLHVIAKIYQKNKLIGYRILNVQKGEISYKDCEKNEIYFKLMTNQCKIGGLGIRSNSCTPRPETGLPCIYRNEYNEVVKNEENLILCTTNLVVNYKGEKQKIKDIIKNKDFYVNCLSAKEKRKNSLKALEEYRNKLKLECENKGLI